VKTISFNAAKHYQKLYKSSLGAFAFKAKNPKELRVWQKAFRRKLEQVLGIDQLRSDLKKHRPTAERIRVEKVDDYQRESWRLWVEPTLALPFYLLRPRSDKKKLPLVLTPHGHGRGPPMDLYVGISHDSAGRKSIVEGERDVALQGVKEGYLVIAPTIRGFGALRTENDRQKDVKNSCRTFLMHGLLVGRTPIGERVWDMSRLLDWALANLPVDQQRIAITGNSGGGTVSLFTAACDTRITVAVPSCYFCTFAGSIGSITHCDCNYVPALLHLGEMWDIAGLVAPRPFCAIAGEKDPIFPIAEVRKAFKKLRRVYQVVGQPDDCSLYVGKGGHRYYKKGSWPFIRRHFDGA
jgi:dienelactone hydrolase